ncbi:MAG: sensor histidine kinase [Pseudobacter sp.]|uniref:sensor histidine kinase n=1 Tax=Pseudobacter sp. TaxID=2045420 RepID=UPI003F81033C
MRREEANNNISYLKMVTNENEVAGSGMPVGEETKIKGLFDEVESLLLFGTWQWDIHSGKVTWSDGMFRIMGYDQATTSEMVTDEFYLAHLEPGECQQFRDIRAASMADKTPFEYTYHIVTNDKRERVITTKMKFEYDEQGNVIRGIGINRDVTEKTQLLRDLMHYRQMVEQKEEFLHLGTWELTLSTQQMTMSDGMFRLLGYAEGDNGTGMDLFQFYRLHLSAEEVKKTNDAFNDMVENGESYVRQSSIFTVDGGSKTIESFGKVQRDVHGRAVKIFGITHDVTKLKEYEQNLEEKVDELNRSNHELEEFAYVASHDLQEPLRKISTFGERLKSRCADQLSDEGTVYLNRMLASAENMRVLIDNLLDFSRVTRMQHPFVKTDMRALIQQVIEELDLSIEDSHAFIDLQPMPDMEVNPVQIRQLFHNLLTNAMKFQRPGVPLRISISSNKLSKEEKEQFKLRSARNYYKFVVSDNGIGFEDMYAERIFQLFQRLHGKAEYPGSGIGLAICRRIADNHAGVISASGQPGKGATFTIVLPDAQ